MRFRAGACAAFPASAALRGLSRTAVMPAFPSLMSRHMGRTERGKLCDNYRICIRGKRDGAAADRGLDVCRHNSPPPLSVGADFGRLAPARWATPVRSVATVVAFFRPRAVVLIIVGITEAGAAVFKSK